MADTNKPGILVLCTGNSARSQMAEGLLRFHLGDRFEVFSAGTQPSIVRPEAIAVLAEVGIDISGNRSKSVNEFDGRDIDYVLTVCDNAKENCPYFPAKTRLVHHAFDDPADIEGDPETRVEAFRNVRDKIEVYIKSDFVPNVLGL
ncbi:MAG: arsenate reductase ArsC [Blastocatellia bacterium]|nr:arsenate reductase ArsC [Chloracidobacterium sp.]MBL8184159.1 arsenate reductase ArsC [Blastocatellia bacterium]HBE82682.1 low molecular weight phosphatase family protein [Blastocatellia bacterium]HRJ88680.1 arsenate reductase ArsC [Pyrinomonadaceae bacterium]HRK49021.1 arsenate reductase ArsC [Pyrinomonadaceae bacterium]